MNSTAGKGEFNPSGVGLKNGNFIGLPFNGNSANVILIPVPWDVTVSFGEGTALGPQAIREASVQLDLFDPDVQDAWKLGIYMPPADKSILEKRDELRPLAAKYIDFLEAGGDVAHNPSMKNMLDEINAGCNDLNEKVYQLSKKVLESGKLPAVIGGEHSVPLGLLRAIGEKYTDFGILQIDAHLDLRNSFEGFVSSHASICYNALKNKSVSKLVPIGIRDYCDEELEVIKEEGSRIAVFFDSQLKENFYSGMSWNEQCGKIIEELPQEVYISFDVDGLDPKLCPNTGTPVPGGFDFPEVMFLLKKLVESGRRIIGFDVCETGNHQWDANVGARIIYKLCNLAGRSQGLI
jgi:agmatinase